MTERSLVVVRTFLTNVDAELARSVLEAAEIESLIQADDCGGVRPHLWMGGVELLVAAEDAARADEVLGASAGTPDPWVE
ncbi:MAG: DUF2007 domain-containing protein [Acidobacteria bacterium]|nr:DUF2007 domain-containing protein [Acidobacteriota bacterium]